MNALGPPLNAGTSQSPSSTVGGVVERYLALHRQLIGDVKINSASCRRHHNVLGLKRHGVCTFLFFFLAYTTFIIYYHLHDDVIRSSAINLHLTFDLGFAHHRCPYSAVCGRQ